MKLWERYLVSPIEPTPKPIGAIANKDNWVVTSVIEVPEIELNKSTSFSEVLFNRRTERNIIPLKLESILGLIRLIMKPIYIGINGCHGRIKKASVSAGALHPIEVLVVSGDSVMEPIIYSDACDKFCTVCFSNREIAMTELSSVANVIPCGSGHLLLFVANRRHIEQGYEDPSSLLWRDAGALLQTFALAAAALGYSFVPLGVTGNAILSNLVTPHPDYIAVGTAIIGIVP